MKKTLLVLGLSALLLMTGCSKQAPLTKDVKPATEITAQINADVGAQ